MKRFLTWAAGLSILIALLTPVGAQASSTLTRVGAQASSTPSSTLPYVHEMVVPIPAGTVMPAVHAAGTYTWNRARQCGDAGFDCVAIETHATYTSSQVWVNGYLVCRWPSGVDVSWCGFLGNGTSVLDTGVNWNSVFGNNYWFRFDIPAGSRACYTRGTIGGLIDSCKSPA